MKRVKSTDIFRLHAGLLSLDAAGPLRDSLVTGGPHRALDRDLESLTRGLRLEPGEVDDPEFAEEVMTLIRMGRAGREVEISRPTPWWRQWQSLAWIPVTATATIAVMLMVARPPSAADVQDGFQARTGVSREADRWVSLQVYRATARGYALAKRRIGAQDALAFSYLNRPAAGYDHLMVFAVDTRGNLFWYYPAQHREDSELRSVPIRTGASPITLPEEVEHALQPGYLRIFAVFSQEPLDAKTIEDVVARDIAAAGGVRNLTRLQMADVGVHSQLLVVDAKPSHEGATR